MTARMKSISFPTLLVFLTISAAGEAEPVKWFLDGVAFDDGATATGSFEYDVDTGSFSSVAIVSYDASGQPLHQYLYALPAYSGAVRLFATSNFPANVGETVLVISFDYPYLYNYIDVGEIDILISAFTNEGTLLEIGPPGPISWQSTRSIISGRIIALPDSDNDGVLDEIDACPKTNLANDTNQNTKPKRLWSNSDGVFVFGDGSDSALTVADTGGCSASQIIESFGLGNGHSKFGISQGAMEAYLDSVR